MKYLVIVMFALSACVTHQTKEQARENRNNTKGQ